MLPVLEATDSVSAPVEARSSQPRPEPKLQDLIPIVMVIGGAARHAQKRWSAGRWKRAVPGRMSIRPCGSLQTCKDSIVLPRPLDPMLSPGWTNRWPLDERLCRRR